MLGLDGRGSTDWMVAGLVDIESAEIDGGLATLSGTSMAAPHVAGIAALWANKLRDDPSFDPRELRARVVTSVTKQGLRPGLDRRDVGGGLVLAPEASVFPVGRVLRRQALPSRR